MLCGFTQPWKVRRKVISALLSCPFFVPEKECLLGQGGFEITIAKFFLIPLGSLEAFLIAT